MENILMEDFFYELPDKFIAKHPLKKRDDCKMLVLSPEGNIIDSHFSDLPKYLKADSRVIYNNSKVINARIKFRKGINEDGALIEIFCLEPENPNSYAEIFGSTNCCSWKCLVGNSKKWKHGTTLSKRVEIGEKKVELKVSRTNGQDDSWIVNFSWTPSEVSFGEIIEKVGEIPIPPYLGREYEEDDSNEYQTIYAKFKGSVAAPTAGLHFTEDIFHALKEKGIKLDEVTLHVGAGTFKPVSDNDIKNHKMHHEFFSIRKDLIRDILWLISHNIDIIGVGTTTVRTLESLYYVGCLIEENLWNGQVPQWYPYKENLPPLTLEQSLKNILSIEGDNLIGDTSLIIVPGFTFRIVNALITNFHQPGSTLLLLISAFLGRKDGNYAKWKAIYEHALKSEYRFLSYGDACLFL